MRTSIWARPLHEERLEGRVAQRLTTLPGNDRQEERGATVFEMARTIARITFCAAADVGLGKNSVGPGKKLSQRQIKTLRNVSIEESGQHGF